MKNLKICKKALTLTTAIGITLFTGCSSNNSVEKQENDICKHLIVEFGGQPVIFRECDGFDIYCSTKIGSKYYEVSENGETILEGYSYSSNCYEGNHNHLDKIDELAIEKGAYVYKTNN